MRSRAVAGSKALELYEETRPLPTMPDLAHGLARHFAPPRGRRTDDRADAATRR